MPSDAVAVSFVSSSGPGGQNVNKRATKAELRLEVARLALAPDAIQRLRGLAGRRLSEAGELVITSDALRSQARNRSACFERLRELLVRAMARPKARRPTRPTRGSRERRLESKRRRASIKRARGEPGE